jgi:hypothetical protein
MAGQCLGWMAQTLGPRCIAGARGAQTFNESCSLVAPPSLGRATGECRSQPALVGERGARWRQQPLTSTCRLRRCTPCSPTAGTTPGGLWERLTCRRWRRPGRRLGAACSTPAGCGRPHCRRDERRRGHPERATGPNGTRPTVRPGPRRNHSGHRRRRDASAAHRDPHQRSRTVAAQPSYRRHPSPP